MTHRNPYYRRTQMSEHERQEYIAYLEEKRQLQNWRYFLSHYHDVRIDTHGFISPPPIHTKLKGGIKE